MTPFIQNVQTRQILEMESRLVVARRWEMGDGGEE